MERILIGYGDVSRLNPESLSEQFLSHTFRVEAMQVVFKWLASSLFRGPPTTPATPPSKAEELAHAHCSGNQGLSPGPLEALTYCVLDFSTSNTTIDIFIRSSSPNPSRSIPRSSQALRGQVPLEGIGTFSCTPNQSTTYTP